MTHQEAERIQHYKTMIECGKRFITLLKNYYENEPLLENNDIDDFAENTIILKYLFKSYLLEVVYDEIERIGQIIVYETETGTHFLAEPKFKLKESSLIYFDYPGNIFIGSKDSAFPVPSKSAEIMLREVCK